MATVGGFGGPSLPVSSSLQPSLSSQAPPQYAQGGVGGATSGVAFTEEGKVRDLALQLHVFLAQAQKFKLASAQQPQQQPNVANQQIAQAEAISKQLKEVVMYLQEVVQDSTLVGIQERLRAMATKLELKFELNKQSELTSIFLVCDTLFYVEICCQDSGHVASVKLAQANTQTDSNVLTQLVRAGDFKTFESHLQNLKEFYSCCSTSDATNMYLVLSSLENVLLSINKVSPQQATLCDVIMNNPLGHVISRSGGIPMKLVFFIHPCDVLKCPSLQLQYSPDSEEQGLWEKDVGVSAKLLLETSEKIYPLSINPNLFDVSKASFFPITPANSVHIKLNYVLHISKQFPVCGAIKKEMFNVVYSAEQQNYQPPSGPHINQLIAKETARSRGVEVCTNKSQLVCLPGQCHYYYMPPELRSQEQSYPPEECGIIMTKVSFLHPVHIFSIVTLLRKQLVYNCLVSSLLGRPPKDRPPPTQPEEEEEVVFEVTTQPPSKVTITLDMWSEEDHLAVEFLIPEQEPTSLSVKVVVGKDETSKVNKTLSMIVRRCLSIPVTLYAAIKSPQLLEGEAARFLQNYLQTVHSFNAELGSTGAGLGGRGGGSGRDANRTN